MNNIKLSATLITASIFQIGCCQFDGHDQTSKRSGLAETVSAPVKSTALATISHENRPVSMVNADVLSSAYDSNEIMADSKYKGEVYEIRGIVGDVRKDIAGDADITVGSGKGFEIPTVQCFLRKEAMPDASRIKKGDRVNVRGVIDGLFVNVLVKDCEVNPDMVRCKKMAMAIGAGSCEPSNDGVLLMVDAVAVHPFCLQSKARFDSAMKINATSNAVIIGSEKSMCIGFVGYTKKFPDELKVKLIDALSLL